MMQMKIQITPLTTADEPLLADLLYQAIFVPEGEAPPSRSVIEEPSLRKYYVDFGIRDGDIGRKAIDPVAKTIAGAAWVRLFTSDAPGYGFVDNATPELTIVVDPAYRGQGVGTQLMAELSAAVASAYDAMTLSVWTDNPAYRLYKRLGFVVVAQEEVNPVVTMVKRLR